MEYRSDERFSETDEKLGALDNKVHNVSHSCLMFQFTRIREHRERSSTSSWI